MPYSRSFAWAFLLSWPGFCVRSNKCPTKCHLADINIGKTQISSQEIGMRPFRYRIYLKDWLASSLTLPSSELIFPLLIWSLSVQSFHGLVKKWKAPSKVRNEVLSPAQSLSEHPKYIIYTCLHLGYMVSLEKQEIILKLLLKEDCQHLPMFTEIL